MLEWHSGLVPVGLLDYGPGWKLEWRVKSLSDTVRPCGGYSRPAILTGGYTRPSCPFTLSATQFRDGTRSDHCRFEAKSGFVSPAGVRAAARGPWSLRTRGISGSLSLGPEKNERANVSAKELEGLRTIAVDLSGFMAKELGALLQREALQEMCPACQDQNN